MKSFSLFSILGCVLFLVGCDQQGVYQTLDMKSKELAGVQTTNLADAETFGRWTDGSPVTFKFTQGLPKDFRLILALNSSFPPIAGKPVEVRVGEQTQSFVAPETPATRHLDFKNVFSETDIIVMSIPVSASPKDLGQSEDTRKLGIALVSFEIAPLK